MKKIAITIIINILIFSVSCVSSDKIPYSHSIPGRKNGAVSGSEFIAKAQNLSAAQREDLILQEIISGNFPDFMKKLIAVKTSIIVDGKRVKAKYFVMPDYLMIGNNTDFVRMPMQPQTAQKIADALGFFLSTPKICDDVYKAAPIKLEPHPLTVARDSFPTFAEHNAIIETQRQGRKGLIAGIKKDVVITSALSRNPKANRVAIYGWHQLDGKPIQPVYTGHVDWYVDYSHGIRLVLQTILVDGKPMNYRDVLSDGKLSAILCNEIDRGYFAYPVE
ncbi:hypothetical protein FACS18947_4140 [Bacteroidia bacterium]|nr:hypothetical protein FACS18947_4140 [Bacteroidia bacterium]